MSEAWEVCDEERAVICCGEQRIYVELVGIYDKLPADQAQAREDRVIRAIVRERNAAAQMAEALSRMIDQYGPLADLPEDVQAIDDAEAALSAYRGES